MTTAHPVNRPSHHAAQFTRSATLRVRFAHLQHRVAQLHAASQALKEQAQAVKASAAQRRATPPALRAPSVHACTAREFQGVAAVSPALEWCANIRNPQTQRAYQHDVSDFCRFVGLSTPEELRTVTHAHIIAWRTHLQHQRLATSSIRRKLAALSSFFAYLCERHAVTSHPVHGVQRPRPIASAGGTPAISDAQANALLEAPPAHTLKGKRDRRAQCPPTWGGYRRSARVARAYQYCHHPHV